MFNDKIDWVGIYVAARQRQGRPVEGAKPFAQATLAAIEWASSASPLDAMGAWHDCKRSYGCGGPFRTLTLEYASNELSRWVCEDLE